MTLPATSQQLTPSIAGDRRADTIDHAAVAELERSFRGELVRPRDADYDQERKVWNGSIDRRPALIARSASDVVATAAIRE